VLLLWRIDTFNRVERLWYTFFFNLKTESLELNLRRKVNQIFEEYRDRREAADIIFSLRNNFAHEDLNHLQYYDGRIAAFCISSYSEYETGTLYYSEKDLWAIIEIMIPFKRKIRTHWSKEGF
jgi:hypothetical protein